MSEKKYTLPKETECIGYSSLGCMEVRLFTMMQFLEEANLKKPSEIFVCPASECNKYTGAEGKAPDFSRHKPYAEIFFFLKDLTIYSAESVGYSSISDYQEAERLGFEDVPGHSLMNKVRERYKIDSFANLFYTFKRHSYKTLKEFADSYAFYSELVDAKKYRKEIKEARKLGYKTKCEMENGLKKGFKTGKDYYYAEIMEIENICEYKDFQSLEEMSKKYEMLPFEAHLFHILNRFRGGKKIPLNSLLETMKYESFYYHDTWYLRKRNELNGEALLRILARNKKFNEIGYVTTDFKDFVLYRNETIYLDGSSVAWNNGSKERGDIPRAIHIKLVVDKLKEIGFRKAIAICDNNLHELVPDKEVYSGLSKEGVLSGVKSGTVADEWIFKFKNGKDKYIVTSDKYKKYWKDYPDVKDHTITFHVAGTEVWLPDKIYEVFDGLVSNSDLPELCYQKKDNST